MGANASHAMIVDSVIPISSADLFVSSHLREAHVFLKCFCDHIFFCLEVSLVITSIDANLVAEVPTWVPFRWSVFMLFFIQPRSQMTVKLKL